VRTGGGDRGRPGSSIACTRERMVRGARVGKRGCIVGLVGGADVATCTQELPRAHRSCHIHTEVAACTQRVPHAHGGGCTCARLALACSPVAHAPPPLRCVQVRHTEMNVHSSRSHAILQLMLEQFPGQGEGTGPAAASSHGVNGEAAVHAGPPGRAGSGAVVMRSKVNFIDLAGSERWNKVGLCPPPGTSPCTFPPHLWEPLRPKVWSRQLAGQGLKARPVRTWAAHKRARIRHSNVKDPCAVQ